MNEEFSDKCHCEERSDVAIQGKFRILRENAVVRSRQVMEQKFWVRIDYEGEGSLSAALCCSSENPLTYMA